MTVALILAGLAVGFVIGALMPGSTSIGTGSTVAVTLSGLGSRPPSTGYELDTLNDAYARLIDEEPR